MWGLVLIVYHTLRYVLFGLFWLALLSLVINLIVRWRAVAAWFQRVILRQRVEKLPQTEEHF